MDKFKYAQSLYRSKNYKHSFITTQLCCKLKVLHIWEQANLQNQAETEKSARLICLYDEKGLIKLIKRIVDSADTYTYEQQNWLLEMIKKLHHESNQELSLYEIRLLVKEIQKDYDKNNQTKTTCCLAMFCQILILLGRFDEAQSVWPSYIGLEPSSLLGYQKQAQLLTKIGNIDQAIEVWNLYLKNNKDDEFIYCKQKAQFMFINLGFTDEAVNVWNEYIKKYPNYFDAYIQKAELLHQMFEIDKAILVYDDYLTKNPGDFKASRQKADFLVSLNLYDDAIEVWDKYLQLYPKDKKAYEKMVMIVNLKYQ